MSQSASPDITVDEVRAILGRALGDDRLADVAPDASLLRSGVVTSIELVSITLELEKRFGRAVLGDGIAPGSISLATVAQVLRGVPPAVEERPESAAGGLVAGMTALVRRPLLALVTVLVTFVVLDRAVGLAIRHPFAPAYDAFLERGRRGYPNSGGYSHDDFRFAFAHHEVRTRPAPERALAVVLGDSGTIGSYVDAEQAIPAQAEAALRRLGDTTRVANAAWFGRLLVKDLMILELFWDLPMKTVVFTVSDEYFDKAQVRTWLARYRHCSVNWPLFAAFRARVPPEQQAPFAEMEELLRSADRDHLGTLRRLAFDGLEVMHYSPYLRYVVRKLLSPWLLQSELQATRDVRFAVGQPMPQLPEGLEAANVDAAQVAMLETTIRLLRARGVNVVLYLEPLGPIEWLTGPRRAQSGVRLAGELARRTGATVVDLSRALHAEDFSDTAAHYSAEANQLIGERLAQAIHAQEHGRVP